jgi:hypothetical protein
MFRDQSPFDQSPFDQSPFDQSPSVINLSSTNQLLRNQSFGLIGTIDRKAIDSQN